MPLKLNVGGSRKVGEANYGSRGASVNVEMELDSSLVQDPAKLQEKIRQLFGVVRTSLAEELNGTGQQPAPTHHDANTDSHSRTNGNGNGSSRSNSQRSNTQRTDRPRPATPSQVKAIHAIARSQRRDLAHFLHERFHIERPDDLTIKEASQVIDELKAAENVEGRGG